MDWLHEPRPRSPSPPIIKPIRFRDINPDYTLDRSDVILTDVRAVQAQIRHVLSTIKGTEYFEPEFGSLFPLLLFEPISNITAFRLETETIVALSIWMGSVINVAANVIIEPLADEEGYLLDIPYVIRSNNTAYRYSFEALR